MNIESTQALSPDGVGNKSFTMNRPSVKTRRRVGRVLRRYRSNTPTYIQAISFQIMALLTIMVGLLVAGRVFYLIGSVLWH